MICLDKHPTYTIIVLSPLPPENCMDMNIAFSDEFQKQSDKEAFFKFNR